MKRRILCFVLTMAMVLSMLVVVPAVTVSADTWSTSGTTHTISTANDLMSFASAVTASEHFSGHTIVLANDIDMSGKAWQGVGYSGGNDAYFSGTFDGQGHSITNITANTGNADYLGSFFRILRDGALVKDVALYGTVTLTRTSSGNSDYFGSVAAGVIGTATIQNVYSAVNFDASHFEDVSATNCGLRNVGGLVGIMFNANAGFLTIDSCVYAGTITANCTGSGSNRPYAFGGLVGALGSPGTGEHKLYIKSSAFLGEINVKSMNHCGAFIGSVYDPSGTSGKNLVWIDDCYAGGTVSVLPHASPRARYNGYLVGAFGYYISPTNGAAANLTESNCTNRIYFQNCYYVSTNYTRNDNTENTFDQLSGNAQITASQNRTSTDRANFNSYSPSTTQAGNSGGPYFNVNDISIASLCNMTAGTTNFADTSAWHFFTGGTKALPVPASIYNSFGITPEQEISVFDDMTQSEFEITTSAQMAEFADLVNGGTDFAGKTIKLGADVNLNGEVGFSSSLPFSGNFDGQGHTVTITQSFTNPDGPGGLFSFVRTPASGTVTIQNVHVTGTITVTVTGGEKGYVGGLIGAVDGNTSGTGGTINILNCWSTVRINVTANSAAYYLGGFIGFFRHATTPVKPLTVNFDSCLWDGVINGGAAVYNCGGFIGWTGKNQANGRTLEINIANSVAAGEIWMNSDYNVSDGVLIGCAQGSNNSSSDYAVTVNVSNVISTGKITNSGNHGSSSNIGHIGKIDGITQLNLTNFYYKAFDRYNLDGVAPALASGTAASSTNVVAKTTAGIYELTSANFTTPAKWSLGADQLPCPQGIVDTFGLPSSFEVTAYDIYDEFEIGTDEAMASFAAAVNSGKTYEGKTVKLTADVTLTTTVGSTDAYPFSGNFNGQGHTVTITQTLADPDGDGGLFSMVRTPASGTVTIQNVHVTGTITATNTNTGSGYFGGVAGCVDGNTSGSGGTINFTNVWNSIYISCGLNNQWTAVGGYIGFVRHADGLKPLEINFDSCVWDGTLNVGPAAYNFGGFVGYTGNNKAGRTLTINIENSVAAGTIAINQTWDQYAGLLVGYARGGYNDAETAKVTVNVNDVISNGKMTFKSGVNCPGSGSKIGHIGRIDDTNNEINLTGLYYNAFDRGYLGDTAPAIDGTANTSSNVVAKNTVGFYALGTSAFSNAAKWNKTEGYIACPAGIVTTFGEVPETLYVDYYDRYDDFSISTTAEFLTFRDYVNAGKNYSGKTVQLTADIDLIGIEWQEIGRASSTSSVGSNVFKGTFDGRGYTISNMTTELIGTEDNKDMQGGLFGNLGDGAIVKDFNLTGSMLIQNCYQDNFTYYGSVANAISGTVLIQDVHSSVNITTKNGKNPSTDAWANGVSYVGGLVGFILHNTSADLTINRCEYSGTINCANAAVGTAGIMAFDGNNNNSSTKVITISNTNFSGTITLNDNGGAYAYEKVGGIFGCLNTGSLTITNTTSGGKVYFNRSKAWTATNISAGQIIGQVNSGASYTIGSDVTYTPIYLYTALPNSDETKFVLGEIGYLNGVYATNGEDNTDAIVGGMEAIAVAYNEDDGTGIRFIATFFNKTACTGGGSASANFGIFLMSKLVYDQLGGDEASYSTINTLVGKNTGAVYKIYAAKYRAESGAYTVNLVVKNVNAATRADGELVAIPYAGSALGNATVACYNDFFGD